MALKVKAKEQLIKVGKYAETYRYVISLRSASRRVTLATNGTQEGTFARKRKEKQFSFGFSLGYAYLWLRRR